MNLRAVGLLTSSLIFELGCGGAEPSAVTPTSGGAPSAAPSALSAPAAPSSGLSAEGGECGDDVAIQKKCAPGLLCSPKPGGPVSEHAPGVCTKK